MEKFFIDAHGRFLGSFSAAKNATFEAPRGATEVPSAPPAVDCVWDGQGWGPSALAAAAEARSARKAALDAEAGADAFVDRLRDATPAQIQTWVDSNITAANLATLKAVVKRLSVAIAYALNGGSAK